MKYIGLSIMPNQLLELFRPGEHHYVVPEYLPANAAFDAIDMDIVTGEILVRLRSSSETGEEIDKDIGLSICFPRLSFTEPQTATPTQTVAPYVAESFARVVEKFPKLKAAAATAEFNCPGGDGNGSVVGDDRKLWMELCELITPVNKREVLVNGFASVPEMIDHAMERLCEKIELALAGIEEPLFRSLQATIVGCHPDFIAARDVITRPWSIDCFFAVHEMKGRVSVAPHTDGHGDGDFDE